jgi:hypothetical protein
VEITDICEKVNIDTVKSCINRMSVAAWDNAVSETRIEKWLNNFDGRALGDINVEKTLAAWLLMNFTYFNIREVEELCSVIYRKFIQGKLKEEYYEGKKDSDKEKIKEVIKNTLFTPLGNPSESGSLILYHYRQVNKIPNMVFDQHKDIASKVKDGSLSDIVLIDDVIFTGAQAIPRIQEYAHYQCNISISVLIITKEAESYIKQCYPELCIYSAYTLDDRSKLFSEDSFAFSNNDNKELKPYALRMCEVYGNYLVKNEMPCSARYMENYPLGFGDKQLALGFFYNTPDNTLPIFWCESPHWEPVFLRNQKILNFEDVEVPDEQYW